MTSLLALLRRVETTTAVNGSYTLTLVPHVSTSGSVDAVPLHTTFSPRVQFSLNQLEAQPIVSASGSLAGGQPSANPFAPSAGGSVTGRRAQPLFLALGFARPAVATARVVALGAIGILGCALLVILVFVRSPLRDERSAIRARYGRSIVPVARVWPLPGVAVIDVTNMDALVEIAERYDRSILHETGEEGEAFWVTDESGQFRYALGAPAYPAESEVTAGETLDSEVLDDEVADSDALNGKVFHYDPHDVFAGDVYADELELEAVTSVSDMQSAEATVADQAAEYDWAAHTAAGAMAHEGRAWQTADEDADTLVISGKRLRKRGE